MKIQRFILLSVLGLICHSAASPQTIGYGYDSSGNRTSKEIVVEKKKTQKHASDEYVMEFLSKKEMRIYPNPTDGRMSIEIPGYEKGDTGKVCIYSMSGTPVKTCNIADAVTHIDITNCANGLYILTINLNGLFTSAVGQFVSEVYNAFGAIINVTYLNGMAALSGATKGNSAMAIGYLSLGPKDYVADWRDHLFVHEYGHYIQSQRFGPLYFPIVAIPSVASAAFTSDMCGIEHSERWFEKNASRLGSKYFDEKYGRGAYGYQPGNKNYFQRDRFINGVYDYFSQRYLIEPHPISGSKVYIWDVIF